MCTFQPKVIKGPKGLEEQKMVGNPSCVFQPQWTCRPFCSSGISVHVQAGRKETVLDLAKLVDRGVCVKLNGGRQGMSAIINSDSLNKLSFLCL